MLPELEEVHLTQWQWTELSNRRVVVFHYDNAKSHIYLTTLRKLLEPGREVMAHPPQSSDMHNRIAIYYGTYKIP